MIWLQNAYALTTFIFSPLLTAGMFIWCLSLNQLLMNTCVSQCHHVIACHAFLAVGVASASMLWR